MLFQPFESTAPEQTHAQPTAIHWQLPSQARDLLYEDGQIIWEGEHVFVIISSDNTLQVILKNPAPLEKLTVNEKLAFEKTIGKAEAVFRRVFPVGDYVRCLSLSEKPIRAEIFPFGPYTDGTSHDVYEKTCLMLYFLCDRQDLKPRLRSEQVQAIASVAAGIFAAEIKDLEAFNLNDKQELFWVNRKRTLLLLKTGQKQELIAGDEPTKRVYEIAKCAFCNPEVIQKQLVYKSSQNYVLLNYKPYVKNHLMTVPKMHREKTIQTTDEEILDKYELWTKIDQIYKNHFHKAKTIVLTRNGYCAGQTQPHNHDHLLAIDPDEEQLWIGYFFNEAEKIKPPTLSLEEMEELRQELLPLFTPCP